MLTTGIPTTGFLTTGITEVTSSTLQFLWVEQKKLVIVSQFTSILAISYGMSCFKPATIIFASKK